MIHEDEARRLMHAAAETIEIDAATVHPERASRRTPWLAAAAALVVIGAGAGVAWQLGGDDGSRAGRPASSPSNTPSARNELPAGSVPSLFGMPTDDATELLRTEGLTEQITEKYSCLYPAGRVIESNPSVGIVPTGPVNLTVSRGPGPAMDCAILPSDYEWSLLDLAEGRDATLKFDAEVSVVVDGGRASTLTRKQALDPATWASGNGLGIVGAALRSVRAPEREGDAWLVPELSLRIGLPPLTECGVTRPGTAADLEVTTLAVNLPGEACGAAVDVLRTSDGRWGQGEIVALFVRSPRPTVVETAPVPDVRGLSKDAAQEAVIAAGFAVQDSTEMRCEPRVGAASQQPKAGRSQAIGGVVSVTFEEEPRGANCAGLTKAATDLLAWARGGSAPAFADEVVLMRGYAESATLSGTEAADRNNWRTCAPALSFCPTALDALADTDGKIQRRWDTDNVPELDDGHFLMDCTADLGGLPDGFYDATRIHLYPPSSLPCNQQWDVTVWVDKAGAITGVDYAPPQ
ncbi:PASTA domain-containing protein [Nocardioides sp. Bht2]|uniref:PASTA domain-containing protein n=1 Tax=Nocardioides sp. Bht2 TaxID=3392297 RepID=UPI0039B3C008